MEKANTNLIKILEGNHKKDIFDRLIHELDKETMPKQKQLFEIMCKKQLYYALISKVDKAILAYQKNVILGDIIAEFCDLKIMEEGTVKIKNKHPKKTQMIFSENDEKQNLFETLVYLEYVRNADTNDEKRNLVYCLIEQKIILEMYIVRIDEALLKEALDEVTIINKIYEIILNGKYLLLIK